MTSMLGVLVIVGIVASYLVKTIRDSNRIAQERRERDAHSAALAAQADKWSENRIARIEAETQAILAAGVQVRPVGFLPGDQRHQAAGFGPADPIRRPVGVSEDVFSGVGGSAMGCSTAWAGGTRLDADTDLPRPTFVSCNPLDQLYGYPGGAEANSLEPTDWS